MKFLLQYRDLRARYVSLNIFHYRLDFFFKLFSKNYRNNIDSDKNLKKFSIVS